ERAAELAAEGLREKPKAPAAVPAGSAAAGETQSSIRFGAGLPYLPVDEVLPRQTAVISPGRRVSFATYFNAFPASYWRRWTTIDSVTLRIRLAGESKVVLYRSTARGFSHPVETVSVASDEPETIERSLTLAPFIDGGWYWFDIVAGPRGTTLIEADWAALTARARPGRVSLGITTINRAEFILAHLRTLGDAPDVLELLDAVYAVDHSASRPT